MDKLNAISKEEFAILFTPSWAESLLPFRPGYGRLSYAENFLKGIYDWMAGFENANTYAEAVNGVFLLTASSFNGSATCPDPLFNIYIDKKAAIQDIVAVSGYYNNLSLWRIAYGEAVCKGRTQTLNCCRSQSHHTVLF